MWRSCSAAAQVAVLSSRRDDSAAAVDYQLSWTKRWRERAACGGGGVVHSSSPPLPVIVNLLSTLGVDCRCIVVYFPVVVHIRQIVLVKIKTHDTLILVKWILFSFIHFTNVYNAYNVLNVVRLSTTVII